MKIFKILRNRLLVWKFPYLKPRTYDGKIIPNYKYMYTDLDCYPCGWHKLIIGYCKKINKVLKKYGELNNFYIVDAKEKWGTARLYYAGVSNEECRHELDELIFDMEDKSWHTCSQCGKPATHNSKGYILPFCYKCTLDHVYLTNFEPIKDE